MLFSARKEWTYDPAMFKRSDVQTALSIHKEYTSKASPVPYPRFYEVNHDQALYDSLWHFSLDDRTKFSRVLDIPCINTFNRPDWRLTKLGLRPQRQDKFTMSNLLLQAADYFPTRGDFVYFNGFRYEIINVVLEPNGYWQQTGVWLGLVVECFIPAEGDARPAPNLGTPTPAEISQTRPLPEV